MVVLLAILADLIFGTPEHFPNLSQLFNFITKKERDLALQLTDNEAKLRMLGLLITFTNILLAVLGTRALVSSLAFNKYLQMVVLIHLAYMTISAKGLGRELKKIKSDLKKSPDKARTRLSSLVTRDTRNLSSRGLVKASLEALAKNICDMVIGPLLYLSLGVEYALAYKIIVIFDENLSGKKEIYESLGLVNSLAYRLVNFIPARLASLLMVAGAFFKFDRKRGLEIGLRDHKKHINPNIGWLQATMAGLIGIRLGGGAFYNNIYLAKPYLGDKLRPVGFKDIDYGVRLMYGALFTFVLLYSIILLALNKTGVVL